jgi:hypothetical protein
MQGKNTQTLKNAAIAILSYVGSNIVQTAKAKDIAIARIVNNRIEMVCTATRTIFNNIVSSIINPLRHRYKILCPTHRR